MQLGLIDVCGWQKYCCAVADIIDITQPFFYDSLPIEYDSTADFLNKQSNTIENKQKTFPYFIGYIME